MCCDVTVGIYCEAGEQCTTQNTCCPEGSSCGGDDTTTTESCEDDWTQCGAGTFSNPRLGSRSGVPNLSLSSLCELVF
jgi:hypothetical protein